VERWSREETVTAYWGITLHWGKAVSQDCDGALLHHITVCAFVCTRGRERLCFLFCHSSVGVGPVTPCAAVQELPTARAPVRCPPAHTPIHLNILFLKGLRHTLHALWLCRTWAMTPAMTASAST
jgi:hypothetical protein